VQTEVATDFPQSETAGGVRLANARIPIASGRFNRDQASPLPLPLGHIMAARRRGTDPRHEALAANVTDRPNRAIPGSA